LPEIREVPPLDPERPFLDVLLHEFRFDLTGELAAERSLEVPVLDHEHRRPRVPQYRMPEFAPAPGCLLPVAI
jgi:hypothetical protein